MNRFFYDCEFLENGKTIELISIGIVDGDGREYYAVNNDMPIDEIRRHPWLVKNVWPHLPIRGHAKPERCSLDTTSALVKPRWVIANEVRAVLLHGNPELDWRRTELWAWYGAYDHVALAQLWGPMARLPKGIPMWTNDVQQQARRLGVDVDAAVPQVGAAHNALDDARRVKAMWEHLAAVQRPAPEDVAPGEVAG